jgi:hypothetical protein
MEARTTRTPRTASAVDVAQRSQLLTAVARVVNTPGGEPFTRLLLRRLEAASDEAERETKVLEAMLPQVSVMTDAATTQLAWNAQARAEALTEFGALTPAQLEDIRHVHTTNPHATVSRWVKEGRVFALDTGSGRVLPAFQFDGGEPRPVIRQVLAALAGQLRGWEILTWFTGSSGYLEGDRPVDRLADSPDEVVAAAAYQASLSDD